MIIPAALLLALAFQVPVPVAQATDAISWELDVVDRNSGPITLFLVCLDGQPTSACAQVPETFGEVTSPGVKTYVWKLPPLMPGPHLVTVQSCTAGAAECSSGVSLAFTFRSALTNPKQLRLTKAGGGV